MYAADVHTMLPKATKGKILDIASIMLQTAKQYLGTDNGYVWEKGNDEHKVSFKEIATAALTKYSINIDMTVTYQANSNPGGYGRILRKVEVDTFTDLVRVIDYLQVHDVGRALIDAWLANSRCNSKWNRLCLM